ncbi:MAG: acylphosphatase [Candidatus Acidiferrum sp.]
MQGVGFRYFTQRAAQELGLSGYVRNLRDGRVEVYAIGLAEKLSELKTTMEKGTSFSSVQEITEGDAVVDIQFQNGFVISRTA